MAKSEKKSMTDYVPGVFNVAMLGKKAVKVEDVTNDVLLIRFGTRLLEYKRRISNGWNVCIDVWLLKEQKDVPREQWKKYRIVYNGTPDSVVTDFWNKVTTMWHVTDDLDRDLEVQSTLGVLKEILEDHPDYQ